MKWTRKSNRNASSLTIGPTWVDQPLQWWHLWKSSWLSRSTASMHARIRFAKGQSYVFNEKSSLEVEEEWQLHVDTLYSHTRVSAWPEAPTHSIRSARTMGKSFFVTKLNAKPMSISTIIFTLSCSSRVSTDRTGAEFRPTCTTFKSLQGPVVINASCYLMVSNSSRHFLRAHLRLWKDPCCWARWKYLWGSVTQFMCRLSVWKSSFTPWGTSDMHNYSEKSCARVSAIFSITPHFKNKTPPATPPVLI